MKSLSLLALLALSSVASASPSFYSLHAQDMDGKSVPLAQFKGKVALVVNTASECGFTNQYKDLEETYQKYKNRGLVVLAFPSNDFGGQEPGSNAEIKKFCEKRFKVSFPLYSKNAVTGDKKQAVYAYLTQRATPPGEVSWNFEKFLVNRKGEVVGRFKSTIAPSSPELDKAIQSQL